jgi:hypothetical protein
LLALGRMCRTAAKYKGTACYKHEGLTAFIRLSRSLGQQISEQRMQHAEFKQRLETMSETPEQLKDAWGLPRDKTPVSRRFFAKLLTQCSVSIPKACPHSRVKLGRSKDWSVVHIQKLNHVSISSPSTRCVPQGEID